MGVNKAADQHRRYKARKAAGLCVRCGRKNDRQVVSCSRCIYRPQRIKMEQKMGRPEPSLLHVRRQLIADYLHKAPGSSARAIAINTHLDQAVVVDLLYSFKDFHEPVPRSWCVTRDRWRWLPPKTIRPLWKWWEEFNEQNLEIARGER